MLGSSAPARGAGRLRQLRQRPRWVRDARTGAALPALGVTPHRHGALRAAVQEAKARAVRPDERETSRAPRGATKTARELLTNPVSPRPVLLLDQTCNRQLDG